MKKIVCQKPWEKYKQQVFVSNLWQITVSPRGSQTNWKKNLGYDNEENHDSQGNHNSEDVCVL